jgi:hypothetical protein
MVHGRPSLMLGAGITRLRLFQHHQFEGRLLLAALTTAASWRPVTPSLTLIADIPGDMDFRCNGPSLWKTQKIKARQE